MGELTVETGRRPDGVVFKRSDGQKFFLVGKPGGGGSAVLYHGEFTTEPPPVGLAEFDVNVPDKVASAERRVLAWPDEPQDAE
ncbi:MAG: hypothetical protein ICV73_05505 [Acetobacteraceae bacterium]|nr:hypothetical protein [Acetobacteraceae bacterium]